MNIDAYSSCPCHQEKKIRFCCGKEIAADLNQIASLSSAGQDLAALDEIERAIGRHGDKECLLTIKTRLLLGRKENEAAEQNNELVLQKYPKNAMAHYHRGLLQVLRKEVSQAVSSLQDALEMYPSDEIPGNFSNGFRIVGLGLISQGSLIAGRAHLLFASLLKNHEDSNLRSMYRETFEFPECPEFLNHDIALAAVPADQENEEWARKYHTVCRATERGQFRKALKYLKKIDLEFPQQPVLIRGVAVLLMYLAAKPQEIRQAWLRVRELSGVSIHQRIEAEALAQYFLDSESDTDFPAREHADAILKIQIPVERFGDLSEKCFSVPYLVADSKPIQPSADGTPPPRHRFLVLDRPPVKAEELTGACASIICGSMALFGKQTDSEARIEMFTKSSLRDHFMSAFLKSQLGEFWSGEPIETELQPIAAEPFPDLDFRIFVPDRVTAERHQQVLLEKYRELFDQWAESPNFLLDGQSPLQVAQNPEYLPRLEWMLAEIQFDSALAIDTDGEVVSHLRSRLGLADLPVVKLANRQIRDLSVTQLAHLDSSELSDQQLQLLLQTVLTRRMLITARRLCHEMLGRPENEYISHAELYRLLAEVSTSFEKGLEYFAKARATCREQDVPIGGLLVEELEYRIRFGRMEKVPELFENIRLHHLQEPGVERMLERLLRQIAEFEGPDSARSGMPPATETSSLQAPQTPSQLLVDSGSAPVARPESKLWIPE